MPLRLLLLEDNPDDAELVELALTGHVPGEFEIIHVERLADALAQIHAEHFDVVLSDLGLPDSVGLDAALAILARAPGLPLVVLTGEDDEELGRRAIRHGAEDYLVKGKANGALIARTLRFAIERKRLETGLRAANEALEQRVAERTAELEAALARLQESVTRSQALTETASDAIIVADDHSTIVGWNPAAERLFGYEDSEAVGRPLTLVIPERYRARHLEGVRRVQAGGERHVLGKTVQLHGLTKSGSEFPLELSLSTWEASEGRMFAAFIRDIAERERVEIALARQKDLYNTLSQTNQAIVRLASREELFAAICRIAVEHGHFLFAWIGLIDRNDLRLKPVAKFGADSGYVDHLRISIDEADPFGSGSSGTAIRTGQHFVTNDFLVSPQTAPWHDAAHRAGVRSYAVYPIRMHGDVVGAMSFYSGARGFFTGELSATLQEMAVDVSFALDNMEREAARALAVHQLRESEARFRSLTKLSSDFYWETDAEHRLASRDTTGKGKSAYKFYTDAQIGKRRWEVPYLAPSEEGWEAHRAALDAHQPFRNFEISRTRADGTERHISLSGDPVFDASGAFLGYRGVGTDITERKRAEHKLRKSEQRYRRIFESLQDTYVESDLDGTILEISPQIERLSRNQYTRDDFLGTRAVDFYSDPKEWEALLLVLKAKGEVEDFESTFRNRDGSLIPASISAKLLLDASGQPKSIVATMRDITERKRAENALKAAEEQFRGLVEQAIAGIYIVQDGKLAYVNRRFAEIFGYGTAEELIGRPALSLVAEIDRDLVAERMRRKLEGDARSADYSFAAVRKDGMVIQVGAHGAGASYHGLPAIIGLMQDISEKKRAEDQIKRYVVQLEGAFMRTVEVATTISEMRDPYTAGHERRVAAVATAVGAELGLEAGRLEGLRVAGYLHDVGKMTIPSEILSKPGKISAVEYALIKGHPQAGFDVLKDVDFPWPVAQVALQHHERVDGSGYPQGLKGEEILYEARIMAVADVVEAMSSHRPYRPGLGIDKALAEIERGRGTAYDLKVVDACLCLFREKDYTIPN
ncbi:MAG: PAS domain S-box protein [Betaproteobacteria bacterium]|nr:PAS domain S-box protein [Betaproteobacteria bacterium]